MHKGVLEVKCLRDLKDNREIKVTQVKAGIRQVRNGDIGVQGCCGGQVEEDKWQGNKDTNQHAGNNLCQTGKKPVYRCVVVM